MTMMASPADEKRAEMISRLPDVVRIIRTYPLQLETMDDDI